MQAPGREAVGTLLKAMTDREPEVRATALQTLAAYLNRLDPESARFRQVFDGLKALAKSRRIDLEARRAVEDMLAGFPQR